MKAIAARENRNLFQRKQAELSQALGARVTARVRRVVGLTVECSGMPVPVGSLCTIYPRLCEAAVEAEVVGFHRDTTFLMPLGEMRGVGPGDRVECISIEQVIPVGDHLLGRVLDGRGRPADGKGPVPSTDLRHIYSPPPDPVSRPHITEPLYTGVSAIDAFLTVGCGQRMGIFSGSGVGKSVLLGMIARFTSADVSVIALVGERGREVRDFIDNILGPEGLARSVVVVATSDQPATVRVKAPFVATAIAEYFRDQGKNVALLMDSVTRMAMAQRDIGGSVGEVPAAKGYTPSVFSLMPRLMERAGKSETGSITGFYNVLVEGDDLNEPISDAVRGILDGHMVLSRRLAQRNHFPAIDILASISRVMVDIVAPEHLAAAARLRTVMAVYTEIEDMINIGAYVEGANPEVDKARRVMDPLNKFLRQDMAGSAAFADTLTELLELKNLADAPLPKIAQAQPRLQPGRQQAARLQMPRGMRRA